jgi:hypothetical protein
MPILAQEEVERDRRASKLAYYANPQLSLDNRGRHQYSRSGLRWGLCWRGFALITGRNIHGMVMGAIYCEPEKPSSIARMDLVRTSEVDPETLGVVLRV